MSESEFCYHVPSFSKHHDTSEHSLQLQIFAEEPIAADWSLTAGFACQACAPVLACLLYGLSWHPGP